MTASKYSYLGGFEATSNSYAGYLYNIPVTGTQAHSFIMTFTKEEDIAKQRYFKGIDILDECLKLRKELEWEKT